ncbi:MAG: DNA-deoxyinosine glycosylase [Clostridia bacterium]|nr:DNA-deoxyinosine glycosylase [Clostridia bacterium]
MKTLKHGFEPVFNPESEVLILGSFPSVKSREVEFYYGNRQNRFWRTLCGYFNSEIPESTAKKIEFLLKNKVALWDIVTECEIEGSKDDTIKNYAVANLEEILSAAKIKLIILNGGTAFNIFEKAYKGIEVDYVKLPSTSPANTRFDENLWINALDSVFKKQNDIQSVDR